MEQRKRKLSAENQDGFTMPRHPSESIKTTETSSQSSENTGSTKVKSSLHSLSKMPLESAQEQLKLNFVRIINEQLIDVKDMIVLELIDSTYRELCKLLLIRPFPSQLFMNLYEPSSFVEVFIRETIYYIVKNSDRDLTYSSQKSYGKDDKSTYDFVVIKGRKTNNRYAVIVEVEATYPEDGLKQCLLFLDRIHDGKCDGKTVYGLCTTGVQWTFVTFDQKDGEPPIVKCLFHFDSLFPGMQKPQNEQIWKENNKLLTDILYTVMCA